MAIRKVYLDVCVLSRPFDDQQQTRIHLETTAFELILAHIHAGELQIIASPVHEAEIRAIPDAQERQHLLLLLDETGSHIDFDLPRIRQRAEELATGSMGVADAAHVAFAEYAAADFVTVDDRLLKKCRRLDIQVWYGSPQAYCDKENLI
jgi:predicted nucleic acid-binding protein